MEAVDTDVAANTGSGPRYTDHALLVVWGQFAQQFGLVAALMGVPLAQKTVDHAPQTKLLQLLVATLAGCAHLWEMARGPHPLVKDQAVAEAWGQPGWADPSGVSRTFLAADDKTIAATCEVLQQFSQPFIDREVLLSVRKLGRVAYDADLTGREVSPTSQTYPEAAFGWMGDHVGLGYQATVVSMTSPTYGRILLSGQRHPGDTVSVACLQELVHAAEAATGVRPRRRPALVAQRLEALAATIETQREQVQRFEQRKAQAEAALEQARGEAVQRTTCLQLLVAKQCSDKPERPYGQVAQARKRQATAAGRVQRRQEEVTRAEGALARQGQRLVELEQLQTELRTHYERLVADNAANGAPIQAMFRLDGGFGSGPNVTWLIEMGYEVYTKAHNAQVTASLLSAKPDGASWVRVGKNAEVWVQTGVRVSNCPYPLDVALERFQTGDTVRHGTLLHYGQDPVSSEVAGWFGRYNARQTIEAAIKENRGVFEMRHLKLRSPAGLALAEAFALFAANLVRFAATWLAEAGPTIPQPFVPGERPVSVKQLVRTAANTSAWVIPQPNRGVVVSFTDRSPYGGLELAIGCDGYFQPPLPLLKSLQFPPSQTIRSPVAQHLR
jgi:hypothetical protein